MIRVLIAGFGLLLPFVSFTQAFQFEGEIHYLHLFSFKKAGIDSASLINSFGSSSKYYYRQGDYKWTFVSSDLETEYYNGQNGKAYDKYRSNDTIFYNEGDHQDTLLKYEIERNADTICGYVCDRLKVLIGKKNNPETVMMRYIYYSQNLPLDPEKFRYFDTYCTDQVFQITGALPLRIEMDTPVWPFTMRFEAVKVIRRNVKPGELRWAEGVLVKE